VIGGSLYLTRHLRNPTWLVIIIVHYSILAWALWQQGTPDPGIWPRDQLDLPTLWPILLSLISPLAGLIWAAYVMDPATSADLLSIPRL